MASTPQHVLLSPAELAYLHASLSHVPPIRPDGRSPTQFRPLVAETGILPGTNGSARVCFADGTEAMVGIKAEVERTHSRGGRLQFSSEEAVGMDLGEEEQEGEGEGAREGQNEWVEMTVEIPGYRDDDSNSNFLAAMLAEALLADGQFTKKLWINRRFHWKLYLDILLISSPLSYPLPLLSLTTHLALLATRIPKLKSEGDEDPLFDDDWAASTYLFPRDDKGKSKSAASSASQSPPITLLVMAVGNNIIFDPAKEELAVADVALAVSIGEAPAEEDADDQMAMDVDAAGGGRSRKLRLLAVRTIDPPSRLTPPGVPNATNAAYGPATVHGAGPADNKKQAPKQQQQEAARTAETKAVEGVWKAPRGGAKVSVMAQLIGKVLEPNGVAQEVMDGLDAVELG